MKKILVAVDGSDASLKGVKAAFELAEPLGAQVTLVTVVPPIILPGDAPWAPMDEINRAELQRAERVLSETLAALQRSALDVSTQVLLGPIAETLSQLAQTEDFDLVVVGSTGKGAVTRVLVGSVADRLIHTCLKPVLVIR
ncbi:MAG: universal stress protein [Myxococcales bacterium]|nr:universal stress protein [Myxococcales bacterium]